MSALFRIARRQLLRRPLRTLFTALGMAAALAVALGVESLDRGLKLAMTGGEAARTLVVFRENRFCPQSSVLPERYARAVADLPGIEAVSPVLVTVDDCRTSLDVITLQGIDAEVFRDVRPVQLVAGSWEAFAKRSDGALVGTRFATRRGLDVGSAFRFGPIEVQVVGLFTGKGAGEDAIVLTHLEHLQRSSPGQRIGTLTQLEVRVAPGADPEALSAAIDERFASEEQPTQTRTRARFVADSARELAAILGYGRAFGLVAVLVVLVLVANTVLLSLGERTQEFGALSALGFGPRSLVALVALEVALLGALGVALGLAAAAAVFLLWQPTVGIEGITVPFAFDPPVVVTAVAVMLVVLALAAAWPAWRASRVRPASLLSGS